MQVSITTRYRSPGAPAEACIERVRQIVQRHGWNATAFQLVNPGIDHWFSQRHEAVIGYVRKGKVRVVAGAPVCKTFDLEDVLEEWEDEVGRAGQRTCYFGSAGRLQQLLSARRGYSTVLLGAQPVWDPREWSDIVQADPSLRAQFNRALNKGVEVSEWSVERALGDVGLRQCLQEWLATRGLPPLHFLIEPETLERLEGRRVFVAERDGKPVGFVIASPIPLRNGWMTEQFIRGRSAPNGTVELMIDATARAVGASGASYLTMGLVPLSKRAPDAATQNPWWLRLALGWVRAHGRRFYNFGGLESFKSKFHPQYWEPIYAISDEPRFSFRTLYAIASAFSGDRSPIAAVGSGMWKAVRQELAWIFGREKH